MKKATPTIQSINDIYYPPCYNIVFFLQIIYNNKLTKFLWNTGVLKKATPSRKRACTPHPKVTGGNGKKSRRIIVIHLYLQLFISGRILSITSPWSFKRYASVPISKNNVSPSFFLSAKTL